MNLRRWEAGETTRLNKAHWAFAKGETINERLNLGLTEVRNRAEYEIASNPIVEGIIGTYCGDLIDKDGPSLQVQGDSKEYNERLEDLWQEWWAMPDINGQLAGPDMLALWIEMLWSAGEYLALLTNEKGDGIQLRLQTIHPRRLETPFSQAGNPQILMGVERNKAGKPLKYHITDEAQLGTLAIRSQGYAAEKNIHGFRIREAGQVRGAPWLAAVLQTIADLRDYDDQVLDAARLAADWAGFLVQKEPEAVPPTITTGSTFEIERRMLMSMPPGWGVEQMNPHQPSAQYIDYRHERLREMGRGVSMPLMMILLDSQKHNYSSARFDGQLYQRGLKRVQGWLQRSTLNRLVDLVAREAGLKKDLPLAPQGARYIWTWPVAPHVDPVKEAMAEKIRLANATLAPSDALAAHGIDFESHVEKMAREGQELANIGVALPWAPPPPKNPAEPQGEKKNAKPE